MKKIVAGCMLLALSLFSVGAVAQYPYKKSAGVVVSLSPKGGKKKATLTTFAPMPKFGTKVTKSVTKSGNWSDATIWPNSTLPVDGDSVGIPTGVTVVYDVTASPRLNIVDVAGTLDFGQVAKPLDLKVTTLVVEMSGTVVAGNCPNNVQLAGTLNVTFLDVAPDVTFDPAQFGTGWLSMGTINMCGSAKKTGRAIVPGGIPAGATSFVTTTDLTDWNAGETVLLPGTSFAPIQDELVTISTVNMATKTVTLTAPTQFAHIPVQPTANTVTNPAPVPLAVGNMTRRITLKSENPKGTRGHFMLMRPGAGQECGPCDICHVAFVNMGRTDKSRPVTDPMVDSNGVLVPGTADNVRARYACHSHRTGQNSSLDPNAPIHTWTSLVATNDVGTPGVGWGFNNHDSHVLDTDCISFNFYGACSVTERGSELGFKKSGLQVRTVGSGETEDSRDAQQDYGHLGDGIWLAGPGVVCEDNYMYGHRDAFMVVFPGGGRVFNPNNLDVLTPTYPTAYLSTQPAPDTGLVDAKGNLKTSFVPYFGINKNIGCGSANDGFRFDWNEVPTQLMLPQSNPTGNVALNCMSGLKLFHLNNFRVTNPVCVGPAYALNSIGIPVIIGYTAAFTVVNPHVEGYETGMVWPEGGITRTVDGGFWANKTDHSMIDFAPDTIVGAGRKNQLTGSPLFGTTPFDAAGTRLHYTTQWMATPSIPQVAVSDPMELLYSKYFLLPNGQQLYLSIQDPSYVLLPATGFTYPADFPMVLVGKTNQQLFDTYGFRPMGALAQTAAGADPLQSGGIIGPAATPAPLLVAVTPRPATSAPTISYFDWFNPGIVLTDPTPTTLTPGWNVLTRTVGGVKCPLFVYGPLTAPTPPPAPAATTIMTAPVTVTASTSAQNVTLSATLNPAVSEGTVTFTVTQGATAIGTAVTSGTVASGSASAVFSLPANTAAGTYTVTASYSGTANFAASTGTATLTVSAPVNPNAAAIAEIQATITDLQQQIANLQDAIKKLGGQ